MHHSFTTASPGSLLRRNTRPSSSCKGGECGYHSTDRASVRFASCVGVCEHMRSQIHEDFWGWQRRQPRLRGPHSRTQNPFVKSTTININKHYRHHLHHHEHQQSSPPHTAKWPGMASTPEQNSYKSASDTLGVPGTEIFIVFANVRSAAVVFSCLSSDSAWPNIACQR